MKNKGQLPNSNEIKIVDKREIRNRCLGKKKKKKNNNNNNNNQELVAKPRSS